MTLLGKLEEILDSHPSIDELGFIHPSQFATLEKDAVFSDEFLWANENKLGISTSAIVTLYKEANDAFFDALRRCRKLSDGSSRDVAENEVMKHSRALVLVSCDFGTAWNSRKLILSSRKPTPPENLSYELKLSALVLSSSPKSERAWSHRRWAIKTMEGKGCPNLSETVEGECNLAKTIVDRSKMNYRAWSHICWLVSFMSNEKLTLELENFRDWAGLHAADNSCFHYRACLLLKMKEDLEQGKDMDAFSDAGFHRVWVEELDWVGSLIRRYVGREALWIHRRFLSFLWMKEHLLLLPTDCYSSNHSCSCRSDVFIKEELDLVLSCSVIHDTAFEDYQEQAIHSATYSMWIAKQLPLPFGVELQKVPQYEKLVENAGKRCILELACND